MVKTAEDQTPVLHVIFLAAVKQGLSKNAEIFGLCERGEDSLVENQRRRHIRKHSVAVGVLAAEVVEFLIMSHR